MKKFVVIGVFVLLVLSLAFVLADEAFPLGDCKIKGTIQEVGDYNSGLKYVKILIEEVEAKDEGQKYVDSCNEIFPIGSEKTLYIYKRDINEDNLLTVGYKIEGLLKGGREYSAIFDSYETETTQINKSEFCGTSTNGACQINDDCKIGGCSNQVCQTKTENQTVTTCEYKDCYDSEKYNMQCTCKNNKCKWMPESAIKNQTRKRIKPNANATECPENCTCAGSTTKCYIDGGRIMTVIAGKSGNIIIQYKGENVSTRVELYKANGTLWGKFKNNETKEIKVLPDEVREKIEARIQKRLEGMNITLDEDGFYRIEMKKRARLFFLFPVREKVNAKINSENAEVIKIRNPWWGFLARDISQ